MTHQFQSRSQFENSEPEKINTGMQIDVNLQSLQIPLESQIRPILPTSAEKHLPGMELVMANAAPPAPGGDLRAIESTEVWRGQLGTANANAMMKAIGPAGAEYLKTLDANPPLRLNYVLRFMNSARPADRKAVIADITNSLLNEGAVGAPDELEDIASDPTKAHRRAALRFFLTADAKIELDTILKGKAAQELSADEQTAVKKIVSNLMAHEGEVLRPFEDFLNGYDDSPLKVNVDGDPRFGLPQAACTISELARRQQMKSMVLSLDTLSTSGSNSISPAQAADILERLGTMAGQKSQSSNNAAQQLIEKLAGNKDNLDLMIRNLRSTDTAVSAAAAKELSARLPDMKYAGFSPATICMTIPRDLLKQVVEDESKRAAAGYKTVTEPLLSFCAGNGKDGQPLSQATRRQLIEQAQQAAKKEGAFTDVCEWMKCKDIELALLEAPTAAQYLQTLRQARHLVDSQSNRHCAALLNSMNSEGQRLQKKLGLKANALDVLAGDDASAAAIVLAELKDSQRKQVQEQLSEKGARAVLARLTIGQETNNIDNCLKQLEPFVKASNFANDRSKYLKTEALLQRLQKGTEPGQLEPTLKELIGEMKSGNVYATNASIELLTDTQLTLNLNQFETEQSMSTLTPSYKTKLQDLLKGEKPQTADQLRLLHKQLMEAVLTEDFAGLG